MKEKSEGYLTPAGCGEALLVEKRSKFLSLVLPVSGEESAKEELARVREKYSDASHNCWCYIIRNGVERYSDDGEPQGTAGLPMLEVFRRAGIVDVLCIVTRYYGGTMLGKGGLKRAYSEAAKLALEDAGIAANKLFECVDIVCDYSFVSRIKHELEAFGVIVDGVEYIENVIFTVSVQPCKTAELNRKLADMTAGEVQGVVTGTKYIAV